MEATRSAARRSSSPPANTTWPRTSSTSCWRACRMRRRARRGFRSSSCLSSFRSATALTPRSGPATGSTAAGLEEKMGIHGNATCQIVLDNATGWLVGEANKGLNAMFVMMNGARLGVGVQGLGLTEVAYQNAAAYAQDRIQGRSLSGVKSPEKLGRSDHRASRRAPHAADRARLRRGRPRLRLLGRVDGRPAAAPSGRGEAQVRG